MEPNDYSGAFANIPSPLDSFTKALQVGNAVREIDTQQAALDQKQQMQADLADLAKNPTTENIARASVKYPQLSEQFKRSYDMQSESERNSRLNSAIPIFAAVQNGRNDIASGMLRDRATAMENSGNRQEAAQMRAMADLVDQHPETAKLTMGTLLASTMGPDKFTEAFKSIGGEQRAGELQPDLVRKGKADANAAESDAATKGVQAKYADQGALLDLQKKGWDIKSIQEDIDYKKQSNRIAAMNAAYNRESNQLKRQELQLKIEDAKRDLDDKVRSKVADAESAAANIDNMLNTIKRVKDHPALNDVVGSIEGRDFYPNTLAAAATTATPYGLVSTNGDQRADAIALINTLGSQAFLSLVPTMKGQGSLSNAEGEKLQAALTNLSRKQSEKQFNANLDDAARILSKARGVISKRYGVPLGNPDTPAAADKRPPLSSFGG